MTPSPLAATAGNEHTLAAQRCRSEKRNRHKQANDSVKERNTPGIISRRKTSNTCKVTPYSGHQIDQPTVTTSEAGKAKSSVASKHVASAASSAASSTPILTPAPAPAPAPPGPPPGSRKGKTATVPPPPRVTSKEGHRREATWPAGFNSSSSFGSVTAHDPTRVSASAWKASFKMPCCCDCVPLSRRLRTTERLQQEAGPPLQYKESPCEEQSKGTVVETVTERPRHRRGRSVGSHHINPSSVRTAQPMGWENRNYPGRRNDVEVASKSSSAPGSACLTSSTGSFSRSSGEFSSNGRISSGSRKCSGSWSAAVLDREFNRILRAGVDIFKHVAPNAATPCGEAMPKGLRGLFRSRRCPLEDASQGLVTLFLDKEREYLCWCAPGAAELVPDERYRVQIHDIVSVDTGTSEHPRGLCIRAIGRTNPLMLETDSDELYNTLMKGFERVLERNVLRREILSEQRASTAL